MITFECPGCTKPLEANRAFAGFETRCLRCGSVIRIPPKSGDQAETLSRAGLPKPVAAAPRPAPRPRPAPPPMPEPAMDSTPTPTSTATLEPPAKRRTLKAEAGPEIPVPDPAAPALATAALKKAKKKKQRVIGGSVGGAVVVIALILNAVFGGKKPPARTVAKQPDPPPAQAQPPAEQPKPPDVTPKLVVYEVAPMPRAIRPAVEYELTAAALLLEHAEGPAACNQKYDGKDLYVRGIYHQYAFGKIAVVSGDEKSTPIIFSMLLPELKAGEVLPDPGLKPGQPVVMRGTYNAGCRFTESTIELTDSPAERTFLGKPVCLDGAVVRTVQMRANGTQLPFVVLEPHATDSKVGVTCWFKESDEGMLKGLKPGQKINVRGLCSGRTYGGVRLDNCRVVTPEEPAPGPEVVRLPANKFFTAYEADLLPAPRATTTDAMAEILPVTAEGLGHAFQIDTRSANITYRNRPVQLSGYVKERHAATRMLVFQCGTDTSFSVAAVFSPNQFDDLPEEKTMVIRGVCSGLSGGYIRIDSAEYAETRKDDEAKRTDIAFLPYRLGKEHIVDQLIPHHPKSTVKESAVKRMAVRFNGGEELLILVQKTGKVSGNTLFREPHPEPRWDAVQGKFRPMTTHYRIRDGVVEIGQEYDAGEKGKREVAEYWEPVLKSGLKRGQSWSSKMPNGSFATYTVVGITRPPGTEADHLEIKKVVRDPKDATTWQETTSLYVRDLGEIRRVVSQRNNRGETHMQMEMRLVSDGADFELRTPKK